MSPADQARDGGDVGDGGTADQVTGGLGRAVHGLVAAPPAAPLRAAARRALHVGVGLAVLGVQQFQSDRPALERDLRELGLPALAEATQRAGALIDGGVARLLRPTPPR